MKYIPERYMVSAVPVGGSRRVTGYLFKTWLCDRSFKWVIQSEYETHNGTRLFEIDPITIEPVRVKPISERTIAGDFRCPNCNAAFVAELGITPFCGNCGQALDWED